MPFKGQQSVVADHTTTIVRDLNELLASRFDLDANAIGGGVERIFEQFFHHGGGPLHHFAGGDLVGNGFGKNMNLAHVCWWPGWSVVVSLSNDNWEGKGRSGKLSHWL